MQGQSRPAAAAIPTSSGPAHARDEARTRPEPSGRDGDGHPAANRHPSPDSLTAQLVKEPIMMPACTDITLRWYRGVLKKPALTYSRAGRTTIGPGCLTAVFGMGTGVATRAWAPASLVVKDRVSLTTGVGTGRTAGDRRRAGPRSASVSRGRGRCGQVVGC